MAVDHWRGSDANHWHYIVAARFCLVRRLFDRSTYTMYVVAKTKRVQGSNTTFHYRLYALDISTGAERMGPVEISGSFPGTGDPNDGQGHILFAPPKAGVAERPGQDQKGWRPTETGNDRLSWD